MGRMFGFSLFTFHFSLFTSCGVTPLTNKIRVGEEPFVIAVGEGSDSATDLFAAPASGGSFVRLTFTRAEELAPRLSPRGSSVAFLRRAEPSSDRWSLVVLDLLTNREETAPIPQGAGKPQATGWTADGSQVLVKTWGQLASPAPPRALWLRVVPLDSSAWADSLTGQLLGEPPSARVGVCKVPDTGYCIFAANGEMTRLDSGVTDPIRWGPDSLAYITASGLLIRPLAGGRARLPNWSAQPSRLRDFTYHPGKSVSSQP
ncbi:MAG: TolB family protein [Gemmatimonadales bacterium]